MPTVRLVVAPAYWHTDVEPKASRRWLYAYVYDTAEEMRAAAAKYRGESLSPNMGGCSQGHRDDPGNGFAGVLRFCRENLTSEVVAHETTHAALVIWRGERSHRVYLGEGVGDAEESFAYLMGDLFAGVVHELQQSGCWATA